MTRDLADAELYDLAKSAEFFNLQHNVSGILLVERNHFFQILEGRRDVVSDLYKRILVDRRHHNVTKVIDAAIRHPDFRGWAMRLITTQDITEADREIVLRALDAVEHHGATSDDQDLAPLKACLSAMARGVHRCPSAPRGGKLAAAPRKRSVR
jgi:hypothetical protein